MLRQAYFVYGFKKGQNMKNKVEGESVYKTKVLTILFQPNKLVITLEVCTQNTDQLV